MAPDTKNLLLRLDRRLAAELHAVAEVEGLPVSEIVRQAIRELVAARRADRRFQKRLRDAAREYERLLASLSEEETDA